MVMQTGYCYKMDYQGQDNTTMYMRFILKYDSLTFEKEKTLTDKSLIVIKKVYNRDLEKGEEVTMTLFIEGFGSYAVDFQIQVNKRENGKVSRIIEHQRFLGNV
jgi:hypothetical protein